MVASIVAHLGGGRGAEMKVMCGEGGGGGSGGVTARLSRFYIMSVCHELCELVGVMKVGVGVL